MLIPYIVGGAIVFGVAVGLVVQFVIRWRVALREILDIQERFYDVERHFLSSDALESCKLCGLWDFKSNLINAQRCQTSGQFSLCSGPTMRVHAECMDKHNAKKSRNSKDKK